MSMLRHGPGLKITIAALLHCRPAGQHQLLRSRCTSAEPAREALSVRMSGKYGQKAVVRAQPGADTITIEVELAGRLRYMARPKLEALGKTLARMEKNAVQNAKGSQAKRQHDGPQRESASVTATLFAGPTQQDNAISEDILNEEAWRRGRLLVIGGAEYTIVYNPPSVSKIDVQGTPMVGIPLLPSLELSFGEEEACKWQWHRKHTQFNSPSKAHGAWHAIPGQSQQVYTPSLADRGCWLRVSCTPATTRFRNANYRRPLILAELLGYNADIVALQEVDEKAFRDYFEPHLRRAGLQGIYTSKAGNSREGEALFFRTSRLRLVQRYDLSLRDAFAALDSCEQHAERDWHAGLRPMLQRSPALAFALQKVSTIAQMAVLAPTRPACLIHDGSESAAEGALCVVNTHLFFHPAAPHIRTLHMAAILGEAAALVAEVPQASTDGRPPALLLCGDLNSDLNWGVPGTIELLRKGRLPADFWDWQYGAGFRYTKDGDEGPDESLADEAGPNAASEGQARQPDSYAEPLKGRASASSSGAQPASSACLQPLADELQPPELAHGFCLQSADGLRTEFTNYVRGYAGLLDYVWYEPRRMDIARALPMPSPNMVDGFLPSQAFPSDHLAIVFDLEWRNSAASQPGCDTTSLSCAAPPAHGTVLPARLWNVEAGAAALAAGEAVAVPTDTLYGLAASAADSRGIARLYAIKGRPACLPLAVCVGDARDVAALGKTGTLAPGLLDALLPGPVTVVLRRRPDAPLAPQLNPGLDTLGIRVPPTAFIRDLCRAHGPLALTSANPSGGTSSTSTTDFRELWSSCAIVFDAGSLGGDRAGSTIVDLSEAGSFKVLRPGSALEATCKVLAGQYGVMQRT